MQIQMILWLLIIIACSTSSLNGGTLTCKAKVTPQSGQAVLPVQCQIDVEGGNPPYRFFYDFDISDGLQVDKFHSDPSFVYGHPGRYVITATVKDRKGDTATDTIHVSVQPRNYLPSNPIVLTNSINSSLSPLIIEGLEITNPDGCGIEMEFCRQIVIRNCWFHHINSTAQLNNSWTNAVLVAKSSDVVIENCLFTDNIRGILSDAWDDYRYNYNITVRNCVVENCALDHGIHIKNTDGIEIYNNVLRYNGNPAYFQDHRITGIICWASHHINMHDNLVIGSSSDGLGVSADNMLINGKNPEFISEYFDIYRNTSRNNGEQGIWLSVAKNGRVFDNYIEGVASCGIDLEYKISDTEIYHNAIYNSSVCGININQSSGNSVFGNVLSEPKCGWGAIWVDSQRQLQIHRDYPVDTRSNIIQNNIIENSLHGIMVTAGDSTFIINNTIYGCGPFHRNGEAGITVDSIAGYTLIKNNIITNNHGRGISCYNERSVYCYNDVLNETMNEYLQKPPGNGDISVDPRFESAINHDFFLIKGSPCIDAGDPKDDYQNEPEPNGARIDMDAYGNTKFATLFFETDVSVHGQSCNLFQLYLNFPNPFNSKTTLKYQLPVDCHVVLKIYNMLGEEVALLADKDQPAGFYHIIWDGNNLASGIYMYQLYAEKEGVIRFEKINKMILIK